MNRSGAFPVRASRSADFAVVRGLLVGGGLPVEDLDGAPGLRFWVAEDSGHVVGAIGLEPFGAAGLLRSLIVAPSHRLHGLGSTLLAALEHEAGSAGVEVLVLLTETAEAFFKRQGYAVVDRAYVPDEIKHTAEFLSLCPASAVCMTKSLGSSRREASCG